MSMATRFASEKSTHATSNHRTRFGHSTRSVSIDPVSHAPDGDDRLGAQLRAQPADVDVDDVRTRIEVVTPDR
jgi:hypothetical protein